jgi:hypothetical protein
MVSILPAKIISPIGSSKYEVDQIRCFEAGSNVLPEKVSLVVIW